MPDRRLAWKAVRSSIETRRIQTFSVFIVTMFFSIFAYIWLLIILVASSPARVEVWEAGATLAFIPVIILVSFARKHLFGVPKSEAACKAKAY